MEYILLFESCYLCFTLPFAHAAIYVSYFVADESNKGRAIINAVGLS